VADVRLTATAREQLADLPDPLQTQILDALTELSLDPSAAGKPLTGRLAGVRSLRVETYRVLFTVESGGAIIRSIRHRGDAYSRGV